MLEVNKQGFETEGDEFLNQLFRSATHDLNNILSPIVGYPELLLDHFDSSSQEYEDLKEIQKLGQRAIYLIKDIQMLIRPEFKTKSECDLNSQVRQILQKKLLRQEVLARIDEVNVTLDLDEHIPSVGSTRLVLQALLNNLLGVMLVLTPDQGNAFVSTESSGEIITLRLDHQAPRFSDGDAGSLVEPFFLKKVMPSFMTGLELTVVKVLAAQHQGSYSVTQQNGELHHVCSLPAFKPS